MSDDNPGTHTRTDTSNASITCITKEEIVNLSNFAILFHSPMTILAHKQCKGIHKLQVS